MQVLLQAILEKEFDTGRESSMADLASQPGAAGGSVAAPVSKKRSSTPPRPERKQRQRSVDAVQAALDKDTDSESDTDSDDTDNDGGGLQLGSLQVDPSSSGPMVTIPRTEV